MYMQHSLDKTFWESFLALPQELSARILAHAGWHMTRISKELPQFDEMYARVFVDTATTGMWLRARMGARAALQLAVDNNSPSLVSAVITACPVHELDDGHLMELVCSAIKGQRLGVVMACLESMAMHGAGQHPSEAELAWAAAQGQLATVNDMLQRLPPPSSSTHHLEFALMAATLFGQTKVVNFLLQHNAEPSQETLRVAIAGNQEETAHALIGLISGPVEMGTLLLAVEQDCAWAVTMLLREPGLVTQQDALAALWCAANEGKLAGMEALLNEGRGTKATGTVVAKEDTRLTFMRRLLAAFVQLLWSFKLSFKLRCGEPLSGTHNGLIRDVVSGALSNRVACELVVSLLVPMHQLD